MQRRAFLMGAPLALAGCGSGEAIWAPDDQIRAAFAAGTQPASLSLYTMLNTSSDNGAHSSLLINASQRILFDPAGTFKHPSIPERNDVLFGMTPRIEEFYVSFHARQTYYVEGLHFIVSPAVAQRAMDLAMVAGPVPKANCTRAVSTLMGQLPGFEDVRVTWFPNNLHDHLKARGDARVSLHREDDADDKRQALIEMDAAIRSGR